MHQKNIKRQKDKSIYWVHVYLENFNCPQLRVSRMNFQRATTSDSELGRFPYSINVPLAFFKEKLII
jgi:hypothetical protein